MYDASRFKSFIGMHRDTFNALVTLIEKHRVFDDGNELAVAHQLAIVLYRMKTFGSGGTLRKVAARFCVGDGATIIRITKRVFLAILETDELRIRWPNSDERKLLNIKDDLPGCVAIVYGTHTILTIKPEVNPVHYFNYKQNY